MALNSFLSRPKAKQSGDCLKTHRLSYALYGAKQGYANV